MKSAKTGVLQTDAGSRFTPSDFSEVIAALPEGCPLVGGQAVAWWAGRYEITTLNGEKFDPITSADIDCWGDRASLKAYRRLEKQGDFQILPAIPITDLRRAVMDRRQSEPNRRRLSNFVNVRWPRLHVSETGVLR